MLITSKHCHVFPPEFDLHKKGISRTSNQPTLVSCGRLDRFVAPTSHAKETTN